MDAAATYWLIDLENTGPRWTSAAGLFVPGDTAVIFWSDKTRSDWPLGSLPDVPDLRYIFTKCGNGTPNAMDFQICAWLGRTSREFPDARFVILSGDKGYAPLESFMGRFYGTDVSLLDPNGTGAPGHEKNDAAVRMKYDELLRQSGMSDPDDRRVMAGILMCSMRLPQNRRKLDTRNRLCTKYGAQDGNLRYNAARDVITQIAQNGPWPAPAPMPAPEPADTPAPASAAKLPTSDMINRALSGAGVMLKTGQVAKAQEALARAAACPGRKAAGEQLDAAARTIFRGPYQAKARLALRELMHDIRPDVPVL